MSESVEVGNGSVADEAGEDADSVLGVETDSESDEPSVCGGKVDVSDAIVVGISVPGKSVATSPDSSVDSGGEASVLLPTGMLESLPNGEEGASIWSVEEEGMVLVASLSAEPKPPVPLGELPESVSEKPESVVALEVGNDEEPNPPVSDADEGELVSSPESDVGTEESEGLLSVGESELGLPSPESLAEADGKPLSVVDGIPSESELDRVGPPKVSVGKDSLPVPLGTSDSLVEESVETPRSELVLELVGAAMLEPPAPLGESVGSGSEGLDEAV